MLTAAEDAPESVALISVTGKAQIAQAEVTRTARTASMIWSGVLNQTLARNRMSRNLAIAVSAAETAPYMLDAGKELVLEMSRMGSIKVPVNLVRRGEFKGPVALSAVGLPPNVPAVAQATVAADKAAGEIEIKLPNNAPLGVYSFFVLGVTDVSYARNPEALAAALERKAALEKIAADETAAAKAAADAKAAAEAKLNETTAASQKATEAVKVSEKNSVDAQAAAAAAATKVTEAQTALGKDSTNQALIDAKQAADKAAEEATAKLKVAVDAKAAADKAAAEAAEQLKLATDAKPVADKAAADSDAKAKQVAAFLTTFNQQLSDLQNKSKANNIKVGAASPSMTLKITPSPITLEVAPPAAPLKQGAKFELPVKVGRLYAYADPIQLKLVLPAGVSGISAAPATIAQGELQGTLVIEANKDATPGTHKVTVQAVPKFGGQDLPVAQEISLSIEKFEPPK